MITRKDLKEYSPQEIYEALRTIIYYGCEDLKHYNIDKLMDILTNEEPDRLMQIIRGYARYGKQ